MRKIPTFLITLMLCPRLAASAQDDPAIRISGNIKDASTGEPIPLTTISLTTNGITTMSNEAGYFVFKIPTNHQHDTIYISHIGYQSIAITIDPADTAAKTITLHPTAIQLPNVTVRPISALILIDSAIAKIPDNYPTRPFVSTGFYRITDKRKGKIIGLSEAVFDIYSPDNQRKNLQFRLIKARSDRDLTAFDGRTWGMGRKPDDLMDRDMVSRIHETQILGDAGRNDHEFTYDGLIDYEGHTAYEISFDQKDGIAKSLYKGSIIIDTASLAFLCFDYDASPKGLPYRSPGPGPNHNDVASAHLLIKYRRYGNKYYLDRVFTEHRIHFYIDDTKPVDYDTSLIALNYLVTRIDTGFVAYSKVGKKIKTDKTIEHQVRENTTINDNYWENYNAIEANFNVDSALNAIRANNSKVQRK
jgi:CarboxypepD_reg-like domain